MPQKTSRRWMVSSLLALPDFSQALSWMILGRRRQETTRRAVVTAWLVSMAMASGLFLASQ